MTYVNGILAFYALLAVAAAVVIAVLWFREHVELRPPIASKDPELEASEHVAAETEFALDALLTQLRAERERA